MSCNFRRHGIRRRAASYNVKLSKQAGRHEACDPHEDAASGNAQPRRNQHAADQRANGRDPTADADDEAHSGRSEEHTSELQSLMRISYAVFCLKKIINPKANNNSKYNINTAYTFK